MRTVEWTGDGVRMIDQRRLPHDLIFVEFQDWREVAQAIKEMVVRGAPAIGAAAAYGMALAALQAKSLEELPKVLQEAAKGLKQARPTAANLSWAVERILLRSKNASTRNKREIQEILVGEAEAIAQEDIEINQRIGEYGASLIPDEANILTHCNAGALATVDWGTALAPIRVAHEQGKKIHVWVDETRPRLQGSLTALELQQLGIPFTLIVDNAAGYLMQKGKVDLILLGADRMAKNGDFANKIGTYKLAVVAKENGVPFYPCVPTPTIDFSLASGDEIPIEERDPREITHIQGQLIVPEGAKVFNPAFDVTPHRYVTAVITDQGVIKPPFEEGLRELALRAEISWNEKR